MAGADPPRRVATAAAPLGLAWLTALTLSQSIGATLTALALPLSILALPFLIGLAFAARAAVPWLIGIGAILLLSPIVASGVATPGEAVAVVSFFAGTVAVPLRLVLARSTVVPLLRVAGGEILAVIACFAAAAIVHIAAGIHGIAEAGSGIVNGLDPGAALGACALIVIMLSALLTPLAALPAIALLGAGLPIAQVESLRVGAVIAMACLAGLLIRSTAWQDDGTGHKEGLESGKLPRALGWSAILVLLALIVGAVLVPDLVTALPRAIW